MSAVAPAREGLARWELLVGDSLELLGGLADRSVDAVVADPPYGIGLRGADWDRPPFVNAPGVGADRRDGELFERWVQVWAGECVRVLRPGGHLLAFGAPRMAHRLAAGLEDAGFELRDQLVWLYGTGVPKSRSYGGRGSGLKPGYEPVVLARAPLAGTLAATERQFGTGLLGIDETRIREIGSARGRWPSNVALSHSSRCAPKRCAATCPAGMLDRSRPRSRPSRFYYCVKASRREREAGCERLPARAISIYGSQARRPRRNTHPTVKPVELMRWLVRLGCPPGGLVLDPFAGSGSTGIACLAEGRRFLGIERESAYVEIARARLAHAEASCSAPAGERLVDGRPVDGTRGSVRRTVIHPSPEGRQ